MIKGNWYKVKYEFFENPEGYVIVRCENQFSNNCEMMFGHFILPKTRFKIFNKHKIIENLGKIESLDEFKNKFPEYLV